MQNKIGTFKILPDDWAAPTPETAERLLNAYSRRWDILLTVHDLANVLRLRDGSEMLDDRWRSHQHPNCKVGRSTNPNIDSRCMNHCWKTVNSYAGRMEQAFTHCCWRNQIETVVPIHIEGVHYLTLFLCPTPGSCSTKQHAEMIQEAHLIGTRLIQIAERYQGLEGDDSRRQILRWLLASSTKQKVQLKEISKTLGVSTSRASHVVKELFGKSWRLLLLETRMEHAKRLLRQEPLSIAKVSKLCGYADPNTFGRMFRKTYGVSPQSWRQTRRNQILV